MTLPFPPEKGKSDCREAAIIRLRDAPDARRRR